MKTKALLFLLATLFTITGAWSQSGVRIQGGINLANVTVTNDGRIDEAKQLSSFRIGVIGDMHLASLLYFQSGLVYTGKGSKVQHGTEGAAGYFRQTFNPFYLEIPANVLIKVPLGAGGSLFVGAGPYLGIGIAGKNKTEGKTSLGVAYSSESKIRYSNDDPTTLNEEEGAGFGMVRRFDYGLNGTAGIEGKSIVLGINYGMGLAKLQSGSSSSANDNNKNRVLSFTVGFKF